MSDITPRLELPLLAPSQAQKHVTHNEAIMALDALAQLVVVAFDVDTPPVAAGPDEIFVTGQAPTGDWAGQTGMLAIRQNGGWLFVAPREGWRAWDRATGTLRVYAGGAWIVVSAATDNTDGLGIQTTWDTDNRLAVSSDAALFTHAGTDHRVKINKAAFADTASLLFQTGFTGHAEMGLAGDDAFSVKVSSDGTIWDEGLRIDPTAQTVQTNYALKGEAVQQSADDATPGRLMRADWGYGRTTSVGPVSQIAGQPSGALIERGSNADGSYSRWADGTQICWTRANLTFDNGTRLRYDWTFPKPFASAQFPVTQANIENEFGATPSPTALHGPIARTGINPSHIECSLRIYRSENTPDFQANDSLAAQAMAVGRWF